MQHIGLNPSSGGGVYVITNTANGKQYVGSSVNLYVRFFEHAGDLRDGKHANRHLQRAYNRYGTEVFTFEVLEYVNEPTGVVVREQHYLDTLKPQYNICRIAGSVLGVKRSTETRAKIGAYSRMRKLSPEHLEKMRAAVRGKPMSVEHRAKIAEALRGKTKSAEHRAHVSAAVKASPAFQAELAAKAERRRGIPLTKATQAAADAVRGRKQPPEQVAKRVAAMKATKAAKRVNSHSAQGPQTA